ncbi:hypothetical protein ABH926_001124 [Catenulispora sp. GP43]|uniref:hypothetical protein n=1 Tax=Catenulispora sp. GP43 TaxID=3156263 RepID=UPI003518A666
MKNSTRTARTKRRIWLGSTAAFLASAATVTVFAAPSQAVPTLPPPGQTSLLVEDFYVDTPTNIVGQIFITGCRDTPAPPAWGDTSVPLHFITALSCGPDAG